MYLETYFDQYMALSGNKKKLGNLINLFLETYNYDHCFKMKNWLIQQEKQNKDKKQEIKKNL